MEKKEKRSAHSAIIVYILIAQYRGRGGWTRSRESEKNVIIALARANQDVDLSSSLPSLAALPFQEAFEIWYGARAKVKVLCYRNSQI